MDIKDKIIKELYAEPEKWKHIREIARKSKVSPNSVRSYLTKEKKKGTISIKKQANMLTCRANIDNEAYKTQKRLYNLAKIYESGIIKHLDDFYKPKAVVLFGSYNRGEDISTSDIDIAVITPIKKRPDLTKYKKLLKRNIELSLFTYKEISEEFFNNLINGTVLKGFLKYERF